jgi:hypothetical protein
MIFTVAPANAEDLFLPYACKVSGNAITVTPSTDNAYRIIGRRDEQPFVACAKGGGACETMMVHRFSVACDGATVPWPQIAQAASLYGAAMPANLPEGYAPVSMLSGRFVLPALTRAQTHRTTPVAMQDLSPDSVIEASEVEMDGPDSRWVTEVRADVLRAAPGGSASQVAASLAAVFMMLLAASMIAAGRWRLPSFQFAQLAISTGPFGSGVVRLLQRLAHGVRGASIAIGQAWQRSAAQAPSEQFDHAVLVLNARLIEVELGISALPEHLLLRDVLYSEIDTIRGRIADVARRMTRRDPLKSAAAVRNLMRELDRISRIAHSAAHEMPEAGHERASETPSAGPVMPQSIFEAYRVLGINPDAAPPAAKKLVDALRMSWHPDHARDEPDRLRREDRMKQINAAWDLIKAQRMAA